MTRAINFKCWENFLRQLPWVIVCKACLLTAVSSEVFDHCKLYTLMTNTFVLYAEAYFFPYILYCFLGLEMGAPLLGLAKAIYYYSQIQDSITY